MGGEAEDGLLDVAVAVLHRDVVAVAAQVADRLGEEAVLLLLGRDVLGDAFADEVGEGEPPLDDGAGVLGREADVLDELHAGGRALHAAAVGARPGVPRAQGGVVLGDVAVDDEQGRRRRPTSSQNSTSSVTGSQ